MEQSDGDSIFSSNPSFIENWRGKGNVKKSLQKLRIPKMPILLNGSIMKTNDNIFPSNTCAFDSLSQAIAVMFVEKYKVSYKIDNTDNHYFRFIRTLINNSNESIYKLRNEILLQHFKTDTLGINRYISCECNISYIVENVLLDQLYSSTVIKSCTNNECLANSQRKVGFLPLDLNIIEQKGLCALNESAKTMLVDNIATCTQKECNGIKTLLYSLSNIIFFELSHYKTYNIHKILTTLKLNNNYYQLVAVIDFLPPSLGTETIGHYKRHCTRIPGKWECYDDLKTKITKSQTLMIPNCLVYGEK